MISDSRLLPQPFGRGTRLGEAARRWRAGLSALRQKVWRQDNTNGTAIVGHVDHIDKALMRGWAWDAHAPTVRPTLDVFWRGIFLGCARTGGFRQDLLDQKIGDGCFGFVFHLPCLVTGDIRPTDFDVVASYPSPVRLIVLSSASTSSAPDGQDPVSRVRAFFLPLVSYFNGPSPAALEIVGSGTRRQIDLICAPASGRPTSAFVDHIAQKHLQAPRDDTKLLWRWYLGTYSVEKGDARAPLSAADIEHLASRDRKRFSSRFGRYLWAVHESRRMFVEDCLVDRGICDELATVSIGSRLVSFPLSRFMRIFQTRNHLLRKLPVHSSRDRMRLYAILMLHALHEVHYLRYMPRRWLALMLKDLPKGILFERAQQEMFGEGIFVSKQTFLRLVGAKGLDLAAATFEGTRYRGHRVRGGNGCVGAPDVEVQLIGPFGRSLGLSESCRRIAVALRDSGRTVNFVDYDVGCSAASPVPDVTVGEMRRARVNILHLNAEEVPEAVAYLPDGFARSHIVIVPYWELDHLSAAHRLGLEIADEVWAASHFVGDVFAGSKPVTHIGMSYDERRAISATASDGFVARLAITPSVFTVVTISDALSWTQRKNVLGAVDAFQAAFRDERGVQLIVKTRNVGGPLSQSQSTEWDTIVARCKNDPRIKIIDVDIAAFEQKALLNAADCLLSLHRAEGLGLDILDALHCGTAVVATAYSGNMDVCNTETAWLVDFDLKRVDPGDYVFVEPGHVWAEPRLDSAVAALRDVYRDKTRRETRTAAAQLHARSIASPQVFSERLNSILSERLKSA